jgi:hypothetical protein
MGKRFQDVRGDWGTSAKFTNVRRENWVLAAKQLRREASVSPPESYPGERRYEDAADAASSLGLRHNSKKWVTAKQLISEVASDSRAMLLVIKDAQKTFDGQITREIVRRGVQLAEKKRRGMNKSMLMKGDDKEGRQQASKQGYAPFDSKKGGLRKPGPHGGYQYWYPGEGMSEKPHDDEHGHLQEEHDDAAPADDVQAEFKKLKELAEKHGATMSAVPHGKHTMADMAQLRATLEAGISGDGDAESKGDSEDEDEGDAESKGDSEDEDEGDAEGDSAETAPGIDGKKEDNPLAQYKQEVIGDDKKQAANIAKQMAAGISKAADVCQKSPPVCKGNKNIPRSEMPQLLDESFDELRKDPKNAWKVDAAIEAGADPNMKGSMFDAFMDQLKSEGVDISKGKLPVGELKATQREIKASKAFGMADAHLKGKYNPGEAPIVVSKDNFILDGHHRYAAMLTIGPDREMNVIQVDMTMDDMLKKSFKMPGVFRADMQDNVVPGGTPKRFQEGSGDGKESEEGKSTTEDGVASKEDIQSELGFELDDDGEPIGHDVPKGPHEIRKLQKQVDELRSIIEGLKEQVADVHQVVYDQLQGDMDQVHKKPSPQAVFWLASMVASFITIAGVAISGAMLAGPVGAILGYAVGVKLNMSRKQMLAAQETARNTRPLVQKSDILFDLNTGRIVVRKSRTPVSQKVPQKKAVAIALDMDRHGKLSKNLDEVKDYLRGGKSLVSAVRAAYPKYTDKHIRAFIAEYGVELGGFVSKSSGERVAAPPPPPKPAVRLRGRKPTNDHGHRDDLTPGQLLPLRKTHGSGFVLVTDNGSFEWDGLTFTNGNRLLKALYDRDDHKMTIRRYFGLEDTDTTTTIVGVLKRQLTGTGVLVAKSRRNVMLQGNLGDALPAVYMPDQFSTFITLEPEEAISLAKALGDAR